MSFITKLIFLLIGPRLLHCIRGQILKSAFYFFFLVFIWLLNHVTWPKLNVSKTACVSCQLLSILFKYSFYCGKHHRTLTVSYWGLENERTYLAKFICIYYAKHWANIQKGLAIHTLCNQLRFYLYLYYEEKWFINSSKCCALIKNVIT